jgi:amidohydrolase
MSIDAKTLLAEAETLRPALLTDRRTLHRNPEAGPVLPHTAVYVKQRLTELGYAPRDMAGGVTVDITGTDTGRCVLLRTDMDALRIREATGLEFQSENGAMHACGHDLHTAMLLGAAALLRQHQAELQGTVRLVFQPDEEGFTGAKSMLSAGVLKEAPVPRAALALHVNSGTPSGMVLCGEGTFMAGCTLFRITVNGVGCHGAMPEKGVDPLNIASHIYLSLQEIISREIGAKTPAVVTIGRMTGGEAPNIIPQTAVLEGTIRSFDRDLSAQIFTRIGEIAQCTAQAFRGTAVTEEITSAPPLRNDAALTNRMADLAGALFGEKLVYRLDEGGMGSEDFASYTYDLPCAYLLIGAGTKQENPAFGEPMHNERVVFNEDILPRGAALHTWCALNWLADEGNA